MKTLDIDAVHAFVLTAELNSFTRAAEAMDSTQSAVSLKIGKLEKSLGRRLLERTPRQVRLSFDGELFLPAAKALLAAHAGALEAFGRTQRRLVIGVSHHIVGPELPALLRRVSEGRPGLTLEIRVAPSREILELFDRNDMDAAIVLRHDSRRLDGEIIHEESFGWMAAPDFHHQPGEPLKLATQAAPCSVRSMAIDVLDAAGLPWNEVFVGGGVGTIGAAVSAGLATAALGRRVAPADTIDVGPRFALPALPTRAVVLHAHVTDEGARGALRALGAAIRASEKAYRLP
ncbi:LysR family transcriptional regulator [Cupriavidus pampae]|uniref:HTH-type transcriptional regulator CysL n=1 Tax=Cupriavidus pampae TaxID=659251 RepID=A0ABM8XZ91_9BURK|nr:LysR family transcriptional regulator [Cupriavidus pampae]CAG9185775.1 HTH-type transcriptional regulator CysL [Cupriavidus pampae]